MAQQNSERYQARLTSEGLVLEVARQSIQLQARPIGTGQDAVILFNFDPRLDSIRQAGVQALTDAIIATTSLPDCIITPESTKSVPMVTDLAQGLNSHPEVIIAAKDEDYDRLAQRLGSDATIIDYVPVTAAGQARYLGVTHAQLQRIEGQQAIIVDDVYSTGATITAIRQLAGPDLPSYVVALEQPAIDLTLAGDQLRYRFAGRVPGVTASVMLPLITGDDVVTITAVLEN